MNTGVQGFVWPVSVCPGTYMGGALLGGRFSSFHLLRSGRPSSMQLHQFTLVDALRLRLPSVCM